MASKPPQKSTTAPKSAATMRGLGRGLSTLLGDSGITTAANSVAPSDKREYQQIPLEWINVGPWQPRRKFDREQLDELADSIRQKGIVQPILLRPMPKQFGRFQLVAGERRWRATQMAGLDTIPAIVKPVGDEAAIAMSLIENIQRENLNPIEEAMALKRLQDEFELTQQEVADAVGKSRVTVTNLMRLIGLHIDVRRMLEHGDLEMGHARALLALPNEQQTSAARVVSGKSLSVRQTEALVRRLIANKGSSPGRKQPDPDIKNLEEKLAEKLGTKVMIQHSAKGKGTLAIKYSSLDELDGILDHIN